MRTLLFVVPLLAACQSKSEGALEKFATKYSCPEDQVTVTPRPDLDAATLLAPDFDDKPPSAEVAADPARLAKWNADQAARKATWMNGYGGYEVFAVSGCGHAMTYGCHRPTGRANNSTGVSCEESRLDAAREKADAKAARKKARDEARAAAKTE